VLITKAEFDCLTRDLHLDATSDGGYDPDVTLTASLGNGIVIVMEERGNDHYHLHETFPGCPYEVIVTSSLGGSDSVWLE
jgi:hypothetical protein